ncbi:MAG TPA: DNA alkylation repair protein, partial [Bryobacteraceae bacterium]|nr:DNA alkylation repair protein [Bryobacteraceae bacterium]
DSARLFGYCLRCAPERGFFIRKAIGWALRDYRGRRPASYPNRPVAGRISFGLNAARENNR